MGQFAKLLCRSSVRWYLYPHSQQLFNRLGCQGSLRQLLSQTGINRSRRHQAKTTMSVFMVVPVDELSIPPACMFNAVEMLRVVGSLLQGLELSLAEGIVIRPINGMPPSMTYMMKICQK